jgi:hypothetical protein
MSIAQQLAEVNERIAHAARAASRPPQEVALMAVSKTHPPSAILEAVACGQLLFGENRVQEWESKREEVLASPFLKNAQSIQMHLIGHLQSNKAAKAAELFDAIDSLDSLRLAERLNQSAERLGKTLTVLVEVNVGGELSKAGLAPTSPELFSLFDAAPRLTHLRLAGLMTVPPFTPDPAGARPYFVQLRQLRDQLRQRTGLPLPQLSMGMSHDFEIAIQEGSTCVRLGTLIFGARDYSSPTAAPLNVAPPSTPQDKG